jgi:hypothetical protein
MVQFKIYIEYVNMGNENVLMLFLQTIYAVWGKHFFYCEVCPKLEILGGWDGLNYLNTVASLHLGLVHFRKSLENNYIFFYHIFSTLEWTSLPQMNFPRSYHTMGLINST